LIYFLFSFWLSFTHSDKIYYFINLSRPLNSDNREHNFRVWNKYSWFLYIVNKKDEAIAANIQAQRIVDEYFKTTQDSIYVNYSLGLKQQNQLIKDNNWTDFEK
jgi:hypothetical protein